MTTPEFTDDELATLRRFDTARDDRRPWAQDPLTPSGPIVYGHELVPHPLSKPEGIRTATAVEWARAEGAQAWSARGLAWHLVKGLSPADRTPEEMQDYLDAHTEWVQAFTIWFLLRHVSDDVVRDLGEILDFGDCLDEILWDWLREHGIDVKRIRSFPTRAEMIADIGKRRAEREAQGEP